MAATTPDFGTFKYDDDFGAWVTTVTARALDVFKWEQEPTGAVLTDGQDILGTGYMGEADLFDSEGDEDNDEEDDE